MKFVIRGKFRKDVYHGKIIVNTAMSDRQFLLYYNGDGTYKAFRFENDKKGVLANSSIELETLVKYIREDSYRLKEESYVI